MCHTVLVKIRGQIRELLFSPSTLRLSDVSTALSTPGHLAHEHLCSFFSLPYHCKDAGITDVHRHIKLLTWVAGIELLSSRLCGKYFTHWAIYLITPSPGLSEPHYVAQTGFELVILLTQPPECWELHGTTMSNFYFVVCLFHFWGLITDWLVGWLISWERVFHCNSD